MKRFILFAGRKYYALGGWKDFESSYDTLEQAIAVGRDILGKVTDSDRRLGKQADRWFHVVDIQKVSTDESEIVHEEGEEAYN